MLVREVERMTVSHIQAKPHFSSYPFLITTGSLSLNPHKFNKSIIYTKFSHTPFPSCLINQTVGLQLTSSDNHSNKVTRELVNACQINKNKKKKKRVFLLDVNPLCYNGSVPSFNCFAHWASLFFSQVTLSDPVIAVIDGERGSEYRKQLLPSYKARRNNFPKHSILQRFPKGPVWRSHRLVIDMLTKLHVPVVKIEGQEADDVMATLTDQVVQRGYKVVIASPDKDFKQLISEDVQLVVPIPEFGRWSFYTLKHYINQYGCDPSSDLSLRCIMGDETDGVPGIQHVVPGFGRKTALKLIKKHGSLENLLNAAAIRTVARPYAQEALTTYADYLRRNYQILSLRRDIDVHLQADWLLERDTHNDLLVLSEAVSSKPRANLPA